MKKRKIVSKWDWKNYLGFAPDGSIHDVRKSLGGFYKIKWHEIHGIIPVGDPIRNFILKE